MDDLKDRIKFLTRELDSIVEVQESYIVSESEVFPRQAFPSVLPYISGLENWTYVHDSTAYSAVDESTSQTLLGAGNETLNGGLKEARRPLASTFIQGSEEKDKRFDVFEGSDLQESTVRHSNSGQNTALGLQLSDNNRVISGPRNELTLQQELDFFKLAYVGTETRQQWDLEDKDIEENSEINEEEGTYSEGSEEWSDVSSTRHSK